MLSCTAERDVPGLLNNHVSAEVVPLLLEAGADPNVCDKHGNNAVHMAASYGDLEVLRAVVAAGGDTAVVQGGGKTPADFVTGGRRTDDEKAALLAVLRGD